MRDPIAEPSPPLEPPGVSAGFHALPVRPRSALLVSMRSPSSGRFVRPIGIAPAASMRSTTGAFDVGIASASTVRPLVVGVPTRSMFSFTVIGTPCNGPVGLGPVGRVGSGPRLVREHDRDRIDRRVDGLDACEVGVDDLPARHLLGADHRRELEC